MALGDFADLKKRAARAAQLDPTDTDVLDRAGEAVNEAAMTVVRDGFPYDFLYRDGTWTLTAGTGTYTLATIKSSMSITDGDIELVWGITNNTEGGFPLKGHTWENLERLAWNTQDDEPTGIPLAFAQFNGKVRLWYAPDSAYEMGTLVRLRQPEMTADADEPLIPAGHRAAVIVPYAAALLLEIEGGNDVAADWNRRMERHQMALENLRRAHASSKRPTFSLKSPTWDQQHEGYPADPYWWA